MNEKEIKNLADCIEKGTNPVEVAGHGRGSTHKGYLTWLLNSGHWSNAPKAIELLVDSPSITCSQENDRYQEIALNWKSNFTGPFWCEYERRIGDRNSRVDLLLCTNNENDMDLPIELKVDDDLEYSQLEKYSSGREDELGLVFLLGSSSVRDDSYHNIGCWKWITVNEILAAWECLYDSMPPRGREWYNSLQNEALRLNCAFEIENYDRSICNNDNFEMWKYGFRGEKHLNFSKLSSVKNVLYNNRNKEVSEWELYDTRNNTVLNLKSKTYPWKNIPNLGENKYYWEFNDDKFVLKVEYEKERGDNGIREWIGRKQDSFKEGWSWPDGVTLLPPRRPKSNTKWHISVLRWELTFDSAKSVADQAIKIIESVSNSKVLDN